MTLKSITLHRAAIDNSGAYRDAGADLKIAEGTKADTISADRARELLAAHGATGHYEKKPATSKPAATRTRKPAAKAAPTSSPAPTPSEPASSSAEPSA